MRFFPSLLLSIALVVLVHSCDIFDGNRITIKLNGFLINFNGWVYDKKLGSNFLRFRCLFLLHENEFSFVAEENSFQLFFSLRFWPLFKSYESMLWEAFKNVWSRKCLLKHIHRQAWAEWRNNRTELKTIFIRNSQKKIYQNCGKISLESILFPISPSTVLSTINLNPSVFGRRKDCNNFPATLNHKPFSSGFQIRLVSFVLGYFVIKTVDHKNELKWHSLWYFIAPFYCRLIFGEESV